MPKQIHIIAGPNGAGKTSHARFALETTLSGKIYAKFIRKFQSVGYKVNLIFLKLESVELARMRVEVRVSKGGHNIESEVIERRFQSGLDNLKTYPIVAAGISGSPAWKDNLQKINSGTGDGFQCFYSIKPQTGSIYTTTFMNNSISTTSGICLWMLNTESPIVGVYSSGSIYDMFNRRFDENVDFIHPIEFIKTAAGSLSITKSKLENNILTLTFTAIPNRFTIGDKIKINFNPPDPTYDGTFIITNITGNTISYAFNGEDYGETSDAGTITEPENIEEIRQILLAKAKEKNPVLLKVFPGSKATYTVMKGGGSTQGGPVCNVECVGNILTVTYC